MSSFAERAGGRMLALLPAYAAAPYVEDQPNTPDLVDGVAVIPVVGVLTPSGAWFGETSYGDISRSFMSAVMDPDVRAIVLLVNSPGGYTAGMLDLADVIYRARGSKPIRAILAEDAYSAAYLLASACDRITVPRSGGVGSVGVFMTYLDASGALKQAGMAATVFRSPAGKNEASGLEPLSKEAADRVQADVDTLSGLFIEAVARNRKMTAAAVKATDGQTFLGAAGVSVGFADAVASPDAEFLDVLNVATRPADSGARRSRGINR